MDSSVPYVIANMSAMFIFAYLVIAKGLHSHAPAPRLRGNVTVQRLQRPSPPISRQKTPSSANANTNAIQPAQSKRKANAVKQLHANMEQAHTSQPQDMVQQSRVTGAGVVLVTHQMRPTSKVNELAIVLFQDITTKVFSDAGGGCARNEDIRVCAARELEEESRGTFRLNLPAIPHQGVNYVEYVGFFVPVTCNRKDFEAVYHENLEIMKNIRLPNVWNETVDIARFWVTDVMNLIQTVPPTLTATYSVRDTMSRDSLISDRVVGLVKQAAHVGGFSKIAKSFVSKKNVSILVGDTCLDGVGMRNSHIRYSTQKKTKCYTVRRT